jgi:mRNA interferase MazF
MALTYHPQPGEILLCNYSTGFMAPEMVKIRPVVVVSPRLRHRDNLVAVVPFSTTAPIPLEAYHCEIVLARPLSAPFDAPMMWAKCDMIATVALSRLDRFRAGRKRHSAGRMYVSGQLTPEQLSSVRKAVLCGLGLASLTIHL